MDIGVENGTPTVEVSVLRTWGRTRTRYGDKPPTWRRVRRVTVEEVVERWCPGCQAYVSAEAFGNGKCCPPCRKVRDAQSMTPERRERQKWRAHGQRAQRLGYENAVTFEQWLAVIAATNGLCAAPDCLGAYEKMDHIVSHAAGGTHTPGNLQPLCTRHHREKTRAERSVSAAGMWGEEAS